MSSAPVAMTNHTTELTPMTHEHDTQEIEAPGFLNDPKVLTYLEGIDADINRLVLEEDGKLWAYLKHAPRDLCRDNLEAMVAVAFPSYFPATVQPDATAVSSAIAMSAVASDVVPSPTTIPALPKTPKATRKPRKAVAPPIQVPVTGAPLGLLASRVCGTRRVPTVLVDGVIVAV